MKKLVLLTVIVLLASISNAQTLDIIGNGNLRSGPGTNYEIIGKVTIGLQVKQLEYSNDWYKVEISATQSGWIFKSLVRSERFGVNEQKSLKEKIDDYITLISLKHFESSICPFANNKIFREYAENILFELIAKYEMGTPKEAIILSVGVSMVQNNGIVKYRPYSNELWFDLLNDLFQSRGTFPKLEIKNPIYDINFLSDGKKLALSDSNVEVQGMEIIYGDGMETRINDIEWIYKNKMWVKK